MSRMPIPHTLKTATVDDAAAISRVLARAFDDDPMMRWFFPDAATRETGLRRYFATIFTRQYARIGVCEYTEAAGAFWVPPTALDKAAPDADTVRELAGILGETADLFRQAAEAAAEAGTPEPAWYLAVVGADPAAQGQGHGAALLRSGLAKADAAGLPVLLESSKPENLPFYEHFGFRVLGESALPGGGPTLWAMRREPAAA
ncbi:GNAT family N-acetyltransferase [Streptomyces antimicrobicus]|uniref:GNAT family N-acetyltransferase n=1 Tax=Streptomyces antimicrobicus TaxID=2883108 RepID=A0ABS8B3B5_9ACTN|nr:GNAT family N-acetyltransferase [Streptomyces antimicrobicus]MCB5179099.1 GNAT family N-acetyltransferase [Streptomyces antimicrobicus]